MESPQNIKKRLKSVDNINKITKAMEMVAATKMRKSQEIALSSRPYAFAVLDFLATISGLDQAKLPELFKKRKINKVLFVLVSSDKGLAGAFNSSLFKKFEQHMARDKEKYVAEDKIFVAVGEKSANYLSKKGLKVLQKFVGVGDYVTAEQVKPLVDFIIDGYLGNPLTGSKGASQAGSGQAKWDRVIVFSTHFRSALKQEPHVRRVLPVDFDHVKEIINEIVPTTGKFADLIKEQNISFDSDKNAAQEYLIEPSPKVVLENLAKHLLFMQMYHLILEANASEHAARRMAMKTASDNASDLGKVLNLKYNKVRQGAITSQIIEIIAGAESLN